MALDIFLKLGDIKGESDDARHKDEIVVLFWDFGVTQTLVRDGGGGMGAGKPQFRHLRFAHRIDAASPSIMQACASGKHIEDAVLSVRRIGDPTADMIVLRLEGVLVVSVDTAVNEANGELFESVTLAYQTIKFGDALAQAGGGLGAPASFAWTL